MTWTGKGLIITVIASKCRPSNSPYWYMCVHSFLPNMAILDRTKPPQPLSSVTNNPAARSPAVYRICWLPELIFQHDRDWGSFHLLGKLTGTTQMKLIPTDSAMFPLVRVVNDWSPQDSYSSALPPHPPLFCEVEAIGVWHCILHIITMVHINTVKQS